eukprot:scaffold175_cov414-Prasinococcus_capsulatus_cf.AAC.28
MMLMMTRLLLLLRLMLLQGRLAACTALACVRRGLPPAEQDLGGLRPPASDSSRAMEARARRDSRGREDDACMEPHAVRCGGRAGAATRGPRDA